jgi:hypothetical protein
MLRVHIVVYSAIACGRLGVYGLALEVDRCVLWVGEA